MGYPDQVHWRRGVRGVRVVEDETEPHIADAPARIVNGRTMLPFRAIGEAFGADVDYSTDPETGLTVQVWFTQ